jgi:ABC-2 type transport system ATP-binding protein
MVPRHAGYARRHGRLADRPVSIAVVLELVGLTKRFGDVVALDAATLSVPPGRMVGFLGPNGSGKTTAMRSIFGLVRLDAGEVRWDGRPATSADTRRFGYMPESRGLYPKMTVGAQVEYFARLRGRDAASARAHADRWLEELGLAERRDSKVETLSHGNQQRAQLAVSLAVESDLLILDEPFSGLDPLAVVTLGNVIRSEARRGVGVLFSSHQLNLVEGLCDDVVIINRGRVVLSGPLESIRSASPYRYVEVAGAAADLGWRYRLEDATVLDEQPGRVRLRLPAGADPGAVLALARADGEVTAFSFEPPSLADLFAEAVGG